MDYYITGFGGFLGTNMYNSFMEKKIDAYNINTLSYNERIDIVKEFKLEKPVNDCVVIHAAGKAHSIPHSKKEESVFFDVNYTGTKNVCNAIKIFGEKLKGVVFISSVSVYGLDEGNNITEDFPLNATTAYGKSKIKAEQYIKKWGSENNVPILILRLPLIVAPHPPGNLGKMISGIYSGKYFSVRKGIAKRSMVMADDIVSCIIANVGKEGVYNLTDGYNPQFKEIENIIAEQLKVKKPLNLPDYMAWILGSIGDVLPFFPINSLVLKKMSTNLIFNSEKAIKDLNWKPSRVIDVFRIN